MHNLFLTPSPTINYSIFSNCFLAFKLKSVIVHEEIQDQVKGQSEEQKTGLESIDHYYTYRESSKIITIIYKNRQWEMGQTK